MYNIESSCLFCNFILRLKLRKNMFFVYIKKLHKKFDITVQIQKLYFFHSKDILAIFLIFKSLFGCLLYAPLFPFST